MMMINILFRNNNLLTTTARRQRYNLIFLLKNKRDIQCNELSSRAEGLLTIFFYFSSLCFLLSDLKQSLCHVGSDSIQLLDLVLILLNA